MAAFDLETVFTRATRIAGFMPAAREVNRREQIHGRSQRLVAPHLRQLISYPSRTPPLAGQMSRPFRALWTIYCATQIPRASAACALGFRVWAPSGPPKQPIRFTASARDVVHLALLQADSRRCLPVRLRLVLALKGPTL
jgi:hypothetical protein